MNAAMLLKVAKLATQMDTARGYTDRSHVFHVLFRNAWYQVTGLGIFRCSRTPKVVISDPTRKAAALKFLETAYRRDDACGVELVGPDTAGCTPVVVYRLRDHTLVGVNQLLVTWVCTRTRHVLATGALEPCHVLATGALEPVTYWRGDEIEALVMPVRL
jgi:hypothetical protein